MGHKLTEEEQRLVTTTAKVIAKTLPDEHRGKASGIASALVRLRSKTVEADELLQAVVERGGDADCCDALKAAQVVVAQDEGGYRINLPSASDSDRQKTSAPQKQIAKTGPTTIARAKRPDRSLGRLSCVRRQTPELTQVRSHIIGLDPRLWLNGWLLSTPDAFVRYEAELRALDAALAGKPALGDGTLSLRELSYRIFGDEKFLAPESDGRKLLRLMGLTDLLNVRPSLRFDLQCYMPKHHRHARLVVSENLDPWVNMRNALFLDGRKRILGERVHGVVFGNGTLAREPSHLERLVDTLAAEDLHVMYWGDIDRAGLEILASLAASAGEDGRVTVEPFVPAYRLMLKRAQKRYPDPLSNEETDQVNVPITGTELLAPYLTESELAYLEAVLEGARLIPQESVTAEDL